MDELDNIISVNLRNSYTEIIDIPERCGAEHEVSILKETKELYDSAEDSYDKKCSNLNNQMALHNAYNGFWNIIRAYINKIWFGQIQVLDKLNWCTKSEVSYYYSYNEKFRFLYSRGKILQ